MANSEDVLTQYEEFKRVRGRIPMFVADALAAEVRELRRGREILEKIHAVWTYPNRGSLGALLDEAAEYIEPGVFDAAMDGGEGEA